MLKLYKIIAVLGVIFLMTSCDDKTVKKDVNKERVLNTAEKFIEIVYFDKGSYKEFKSLYADQSKVNSEKDFNEYRKKNDAQNVFPRDYKNVESIKNHLVLNKVDKNNFEVFWSENKENKKVNKNIWYISITKADKKWLIK